MLNILTLIFLFFYSTCVFAQQSTCFGNTHNGRLEGGKKLPLSGNNYVTYSYLANFAGRTYVHSKVFQIVTQAYQSLEAHHPDKRYMYAETGFKNGGKFKPHKTHTNGLSVDFMTPVINKKQESVHLSTHIFNKLGYSIEFDNKGNYKDLKIDYLALAAHLVALDKAAKKVGYGIWRVIFDPKLQPNLFETPYSDYLKQHINFSSKRSWVRHDEHYHVDFLIPCNPL